MSYTNKYLPGVVLQTPQAVAAYIAANPGDERARWWRIVPAPGNALGLTTDDIPEGVSNLYYNPSRVSAEIAEAVAGVEVPEPSDDLPQALGAAAAGVADEYSRGDHVHEMPAAAEVGAAPVIHSHSAGDVTSGIFDDARIPSLPTSRIAGLDTALSGKSDVGHVHTYIQTAEKGVANGVAELDATGRVPSGQLPSYVDDVLEFANVLAFPAVGESGKIYVSIAGNTTWRWSGSVYTEISASLALGETPATAYRGDRGKIAYDHSQVEGNAHNMNPDDIGAWGPASLPVTIFAKTLLDDSTAAEMRATIGTARSPATYEISGNAGIGSITATAIKVLVDGAIISLSLGEDGQAWDVICPDGAVDFYVPSGATLYRYSGITIGPGTYSPGGGRAIRVVRVDAMTWLMPNLS